jgi:hypothetical protein
MSSPFLDIGGKATGSNAEYEALLRRLGLLPPTPSRSEPAPTPTSPAAQLFPINFNAPNPLARTEQVSTATNTVTPVAGVTSPLLPPLPVIPSPPASSGTNAPPNDIFNNPQGIGASLAPAPKPAPSPTPAPVDDFLPIPQTFTPTPPLPSFTQAREGGSPAPTPRDSGMRLMPMPPSFTQVREGGSPSLPSIPIPPPPADDFLPIPQTFTPSPTPAPTVAPAPPVSNTVDSSNPWYIAPEVLASATSQASSGAVADQIVQSVAERPGERTTIDNSLPPLPAPPIGATANGRFGDSIDPGEVTPSPTPSPSPSPTPTPAPEPTPTPTPTPSPTPTPAPTPDVQTPVTGQVQTPVTGETRTQTPVVTPTTTPTTTTTPTVTPTPPEPPITPPSADTTPTGNTPAPGIVTPPGNQGAAQNGIPTPPPVPAVTANQVSVSNFTPPTPNVIADRAPLPTAAQAPQLNLGEALGARNTTLPNLPTSTAPNLGAILGGLPQTQLPTVPTREVSNFRDFLAQNATGQMSQEQIAAQARRLAEMQINPELAQAEQDRLAAQQRFQLALSQVGQGKEEALADLRSGFDDRLRQIQAMAIRNGLTASNIPLEQDINPLMQDFTMRQRTMEQGIQSEINRLQLEAQLGDQDAGRRIQTLLGQMGLIESGANFDLSRDERNFGEQARQNRFGEFMGGEQLARQTQQDTFGNQADLASMTEALRGNRLNEGLAQAGLDRQARQDQFGNEAQLAEMTEALRQNQLSELLAQAGFNRDSGQQDFANAMARAGMTEQQRQSDIGNNRADRSQGFQEFLGSQGLGLDLARLNESLLQGGLQRALTQDELNNRGTDNSLRQQLIQSQIAQNNASAARGGVDPLQLSQANQGIVQGVLAAQAILSDPKATPQQRQQAQIGLDIWMGEWARLNPDTPFPTGAQANTGPQPGQNPAVFEAQKAQAQSEIARLQNNLAVYESQLQASSSNPLWMSLFGAALQRTIQQRTDEVNRLKAQYGIE